MRKELRDTEALDGFSRQCDALVVPLMAAALGAQVRDVIQIDAEAVLAV